MRCAPLLRLYRVKYRMARMAIRVFVKNSVERRKQKQQRQLAIQLNTVTL